MLAFWGAFWFWHPHVFTRGHSHSLTTQGAQGFQERAAASGLNFHMSYLPEEQGAQFKVNLYDHGAGLAVGDFDGDGFDDVYFCNQLGKNALYRNKGDGTFEEVTDKAGVGLGDRICVAAAWADYDNSGRQSLFVTSTRGGNVLFKNMGNGTFKDVTKEAGLSHVGHSQACLWFDFDNDGYLDLLVTNTAHWTTDQHEPGSRYFRGPKDLVSGFLSTPQETNILYHNNHDGTFTDVTKHAGLEGKGWCGDATILDYDNDGYPDVLVTAMFGGTTLYHNNRDGTFSDVTRDVLGSTSWGAMGGKPFDADNDGRLALYVVDMHSDMWMDVKLDYTAADLAEFKKEERRKHGGGALPRRHNLDDLVYKGRIIPDLYGNSFYRNLGDGHFEEVSDKAGLETFWPWGIATGDFDNDGHEDIFIASGMGYPFPYWPNYLMHNNGDGTFTDQAEILGIEPPPRGKYFKDQINGRQAARSSRCTAVADFAHDGRLDILVNNFNDVPYYFRNRLPRRNYIAFQLQGRRCNHDAIGAEVRLYVGKEIMTRQVSSFGGYLTQSSKNVHFGLGDRQAIDRVEIRWPGDRKLQIIPHPAINYLHRVIQS